MRKRSRVLRWTLGLGTVVLLIVAVLVIPRTSSRAAKVVLSVEQLPQEAKPTELPKAAQELPPAQNPPPSTPDPAGPPLETSPKPSPFNDPPPVAEPQLQPSPAAAAVPVEPARSTGASPMPDPVRAAQDFQERTRNEANAAVESLTNEANQLRERLKKVESGLAQYRSMLEALNAKSAPAATNPPAPVPAPVADSKLPEIPNELPIKKGPAPDELPVVPPGPLPVPPEEKPSLPNPDPATLPPSPKG